MVCARCGSEFIPKPKRRFSQRFCTPTCRVLAHNERRRAARVRPDVEATCKVCGRKFAQPGAQTWRMYCTRKCNDAAWNASERRAAWALARQRLARQHETRGGTIARAHYDGRRMVDLIEEDMAARKAGA